MSLCKNRENGDQLSLNALMQSRGSAGLGRPAVKASTPILLILGRSYYQTSVRYLAGMPTLVPCGAAVWSRISLMQEQHSRQDTFEARVISHYRNKITIPIAFIFLASHKLAGWRSNRNGHVTVNNPILSQNLGLHEMVGQAQRFQTKRERRIGVGGWRACSNVRQRSF